MTDTPYNTASMLAEIAFGEALQTIIKPENQKAAVATNATLRDGAIEKLIGGFEDASHNDDGTEFWYARDLQELLGYDRWDTFVGVVQRAKEACSKTGQQMEDHFSDARKMVSIGSGAERELHDIRLSRYACYLTAQNGDPRKASIAFAQTYFAIQTRRQEIQDEDVAQYTPLSEDEKRLLLRDEIKSHNKKLASVAKSAGVVLPLDFAIFVNAGYQGLYGGLDRNAIARHKGIKTKNKLLDHMGSTELAANLFRATQTEEKLQRENVKGKEAANFTHRKVGEKVRQAIKDIGGTMPESLPIAEDIVKVGRRLNKAIANSAKGGGGN